MSYGGTAENEKTNYAWRSGRYALTSEDFTKNNLWWGRLAYQGDAVAVLGQRYEPLTLQVKELYLSEFKMSWRSSARPQRAVACRT